MSTVYSQPVIYYDQGVSAGKARLKVDFTISQSERALSTSVAYTVSLQVYDYNDRFLGFKYENININGTITGTGNSGFTDTFEGETIIPLFSSSAKIWHYAGGGAPTNNFSTTVTASITPSWRGRLETTYSRSAEVTFTPQTLNTVTTMAISNTSPNVGDSITLTFTKPANIGRVLVTDSEGNTAYDGTASSATWTVPSYSMSSATKAITLTCIGYNLYSTGSRGSTRNYNITVNKPSSWVPFITNLSVSWNPNKPVPIKGISKYVADISASLATDPGATIAGYRFVLTDSNDTILEDRTVSTSSLNYTYESDYVIDTNFITITAYAIDNRSTSSVPYQSTAYPIDYTPPTVITTGVRCTSTGTEDPLGQYMKLTVNWTADETQGAGALGNIVTYYSINGGSYTTLGSYHPTAVTGSYTFTTYPAIAAAQTADIYSKITDSLSGTVSGNISRVSASKVPFCIYDDGVGGVGVGIGKISNTANYIDTGDNMYIRASDGTNTVYIKLYDLIRKVNQL